ncbi:hypothetical protein E2C01_038428 [Portunus trituberculatus]|uniref:Uncharacterized protein n=1 Tax=Portunus trituberculatus TaxID=210409 RepID=A0A5B7FII4_PORTR|nr:hypothetical protein [Portunus trituberculatus]
MCSAVAEALTSLHSSLCFSSRLASAPTAPAFLQREAPREPIRWRGKGGHWVGGGYQGQDVTQAVMTHARKGGKCRLLEEEEEEVEEEGGNKDGMEEEEVWGR